MSDRFSVCPRCLLDGPDNEPCPCQMTPEQREIRGLRKRLAEAEQRATKAEEKAERARADFASERERGVYNRRESRFELARMQERAERAERELERWRLRLRDRARRRKEETEGDHGFDWLASRERIHAYRDKLDAELRREGRAWALESQAPAMNRAIMAQLREPVALPLSDAERRAICDRLGIDVSAWAQQIRERAREALNRLRVDDRSEDIAERHVCPGCHAVDEPCLPGCIDAEIAAELERERSSGPAWEQDEEDD